jgi:hypothetical protein
LSPDAFLPREIADRPVEIALGRNREDKNFRTLKGTFKQLFEDRAPLSYFVEGEKDGLCLLQGALIGGQRIARNVTKNYLMMFDHDTGETIDEIEAKIADKGLFAVLWTTYNHMQAETLVAEDALLKWLRKNGHKSDNISASKVAEFLQETKKVKPEVFSGDLKLDRIHVEGGMKYRLKHAPMPRVRSMFLLNEPFDFGARGSSQVAAIQEWKERYAGLASMLGVSWDRSCVDPSRLMYVPRVAPGTDLEALGHEIVIIPGKLLDIDAVPRLETEPRAGLDRRQSAVPPDLAAALKGEEPATHDRRTFQTDGLLNFLKDHAHDFEAAEWLLASFPEDVRSGSAGKIEFRCPNEDNHSEQKADDRAFMVADASLSESGFHMGCLHNTCIEASKKDRAWYLDLLCQNYGVGVEELLEYCPEVEAKAVEQQNITDDLASKIAVLTSDTTGAELNVILKELAKRPADMVADDMVSAITNKTGRSRGRVEKTLSEFRKTVEVQIGGDNTQRESVTPPEDPAQANTIWEHWTHAEKNRCAAGRFMAKNEADPIVFQRKADNTIVRVINGSGRVTIDPMDKDKWSYELDQHMAFKRVTRDGDEIAVAPFPSVITHMNAGRDRHLPVLDRVISVPVFAPDGTLRWEKGYDPGLQHFINPNLTVREVPDVVTEEHIDEAITWILEAIRDFPFSDAFDGNDNLPQYTDEMVDGFPEPNYARGKSSRVNFMALMLQPIVRGLIDGPCPAYHIDKSAPGTGAGYLANVAYMVIEGTTAEAQPMSNNDEELRKTITASLIGGAHMIFLDNINHKVASGHLAAALTAGVWKDRILGESHIVAVPNSATWVLAGNNLQFSNELMRRNVPIRIDANVANPTLDRPMSAFKHDLSPWLKDNRANLLWACHVLGLNWIQKGRPQNVNKHVHSFDAWSRVMGGIFEAAGIEGFLDNVHDYLRTRDEDRSALDEMMVYLWNTFKETPASAKEIYDACLTTAQTLNGHGNFGFAIPINGHDEHGKITSLGKSLRTHAEGRTFILDPETGLKGKFVRAYRGNPVKYRFLVLNYMELASSEPENSGSIVGCCEKPL